MMTSRNKGLKMFTFALLFIITITSFLLNYTNNVVSTSWDPKQMVRQFSEQMKKLLNYPRQPCSCDTCILDKGSAWFEERFNITMQPFLTKQNAFLPQEKYRWWLKLQGERSPKTMNETVQELFRFIPGDWDHFLDRRNSGNLRQSQYGQEINAHDLVFRMNKAPTKGFESDVGSKTTHHFLYPESYRELEETVSIILIPFKILDLRWMISALTNGTINHTYVPVPRKIKANKDKIMIYHPSFIKYVYNNWLQNHGRYPSTGFLSIIFALHLCDEVDLYGFGADSKGNWHHYWENNPSAGAFRKTGVHDGDFEANVTQNLTSAGKIRFFRGR
uniref:CMP-N-acetylneuraminate-beta-galactosamide-alpha-2,3-sialyltransferase 1 n=1 Tax=Naja naja TaxID=35670 RepID=A0A8C7E6X9_NAJNA